LGEAQQRRRQRHEQRGDAELLGLRPVANEDGKAAPCEAKREVGVQEAVPFERVAEYEERARGRPRQDQGEITNAPATATARLAASPPDPSVTKEN
jgi:hypothetical protein